MSKNKEGLAECIAELEERLDCIDKSIDSVNAHMEKAGLKINPEKITMMLEFRYIIAFISFIVLVVGMFTSGIFGVLSVFLLFFILGITRKSKFSAKIINFIRYGRLRRIVEYHKQNPFVHGFSRYFVDMMKIRTNGVCIKGFERISEDIICDTILRLKENPELNSKTIDDHVIFSMVLSLIFHLRSEKREVLSKLKREKVLLLAEQDRKLNIPDECASN